MQHFALIGESLAHTFSPQIHSHAIKLLNIQADYTTVEIPATDFNTQIRRLKDGAKYSGYNVTIPYKAKILDFMDRVSDEARAIGAVNTIQVDQEGWSGYNTDIFGFLGPLQVLGQSIESAMVIGAGGAARSVVYALARHIHAKQIILCARDLKKSEAIIRHLEAHLGTLSVQLESVEFAAQHYAQADLIVNTTPLGMYPHVNDMPFRPEIRSGRRLIFYDLVYNPLKTQFLQQAGVMCPQAVLIGGLDMLIQQAAQSFEIWTGLTFPEFQVRSQMLSILS